MQKNWMAIRFRKWEEYSIAIRLPETEGYHPKNKGVSVISCELSD
jgi:hypothetical protein